MIMARGVCRVIKLIIMARGISGVANLIFFSFVNEDFAWLRKCLGQRLHLVFDRVRLFV